MNSFLERATLLNVNLGIFQGFCLKVSMDFFHRKSPCIFVVIINRLCVGLFKNNPELCQDKINIRSIHLLGEETTAFLILLVDSLDYYSEAPDGREIMKLRLQWNLGCV